MVNNLSYMPARISLSREIYFRQKSLDVLRIVVQASGQFTKCRALCIFEQCLTNSSKYLYFIPHHCSFLYFGLVRERHQKVQ